MPSGTSASPAPARRPVPLRVALGFMCLAGLAALPACGGRSASSQPDIDVGVRTAAVVRPISGAMAPAPSFSGAGYPRFVPSYDDGPGPMPADEIACRRELKRLGVRFTELPAIREGSCGIDYPVEVSALSGGVDIRPDVTLNCRMAATFARWTKKELAPAARLRYLSGIRTIHQGSGYSCRNIAGSRTMSEHSTGNAIDIMRIELKNGRDIDVRKPGFFSFREKSLLNNVRAGGCEYFSTVLGPGYNYNHRNHFHFDIKPRRNGRVSCN